MQICVTFYQKPTDLGVDHTLTVCCSATDKDTSCFETCKSFVLEKRCSGDDLPGGSDPRCTDSDGKDIFEKGVVKWTDNNQTAIAGEDYCANDNTVSEYLCLNSEPGYITYPCQNGCRDGACIR